MANSIFSLFMIVFFIFLAGLFAGAETGLYRLSRLRLRLGVEKKKFTYIMLNRCVHDSSGMLFTMLIGTNLSYYLATSFITVLFLKQVEDAHTAEIATTLITAPILFVFSESIPKNIFLYRADYLMPYVAPFMYGFHKLLNICGAVPLLKLISRFFSRVAGSAALSKEVITSAQRHSVQAFLKETHDEGILSSVQTDIINRLVKISHVHVKSVMIPMEKVQTAEVNSSNSALLEILRNSTFTRLPVVDSKAGNITGREPHGRVIGFINIYETLSSSSQFENLNDFIKPIHKISSETTVIDAINFMQANKARILLVTKTFRTAGEKNLGIVTMKDLVEELLGELAEW